MACASGEGHTITLSNEGIVYSFGKNYFGQLGLGHYTTIDSPVPITNAPRIKQISCGANFTFCVDFEGFLWSFGENYSGQLGTGNKTTFNTLQKITNIPLVNSVACGSSHTLIITTNSNLWSCGSNSYGQLCIETHENQITFQQTSFSNISRVSVGGHHSLFENKGEIFSCGLNVTGELGLGHFDSLCTPSFIPNLPPNIIQFICGNSHNLFLDSDGNVYSVGHNLYGQLGLGHKTNQNVLNQIPNIPPIQVISCVGFSSYLIDFEGNIWSFGYNCHGQLGHGDKLNKCLPTKIESLKDIQQVSYGSCGEHFLAQDSQNTIFGAGFNNYGQLGASNTEFISVSIPQEMNVQYLTIWGDVLHSKAKSARK